MSNKNVLEKVKKLRELTGVGFKDCKNAIDENNGDIDKSIEFLRKKGIAKANKKMERVAADGLISISEKGNKFSIIEVNSETDFVAKNEIIRDKKKDNLYVEKETKKIKPEATGNEEKKQTKKKEKVKVVEKISKSIISKAKSLITKKTK